MKDYTVHESNYSPGEIFRLVKALQTGVTLLSAI